MYRGNQHHILLPTGATVTNRKATDLKQTSPWICHVKRASDDGLPRPVGVYGSQYELERFANKLPRYEHLQVSV